MLYPPKFECLSVRQSAVHHSCPLHNFDTARDNSISREKEKSLYIQYFNFFLLNCNHELFSLNQNQKYSKYINQFCLIPL